MTELTMRDLIRLSERKTETKHSLIDEQKEELFYNIINFLDNHKVSDLMEVVNHAIIKNDINKMES